MTTQDRLEALLDDYETLHGYISTGSTDGGRYVLTLRTWPHRDVGGATCLSLRYAFLSTADDTSDGWAETGMNMRLPRDVDAHEGVATIRNLFGAAHANLSDDDEHMTYGFDL